MLFPDFHGLVLQLALANGIWVEGTILNLGLKRHCVFLLALLGLSGLHRKRIYIQEANGPAWGRLPQPTGTPVSMRINAYRVLLGHTGLRIQHCYCSDLGHCCGMGSMDPWSGNFHMLWVWPKEKERERE